ncbi:MAG: flavin reductase family protein [Candidatus Devosia phytovorans]|uniref:Flavin reductase family protein n=1 Tax=Candidatus Devosia phytovorans TaxID=3121372 RepID=A0AAJ6B1Q0_9HYPH|nr:flavin reductase family protein [Devosia sp.]WEK05991.1 MAG: flavin reductase family protein [Devosia sp.]
MLDRLPVETGQQVPDFRLVMRQLAAGVSVVTASTEMDRSGFTATSVISLSVEPPRLLVSINQQSSTLDLIRRSGEFSVSFLSSAQEHIAENFAGRSGLDGARRFESGSWLPMSGTGHALEGALANMGCVVEEMIERHDHVLTIGRVAWSDTRNGQPLVHWNRKFG